MINNTVAKILQIRQPIIQAPMAGGVTTSELVAEVSNCGGLGMIGAGYMTPNQMEEQIREIKKLTQNFFGVNLFVPNDFKVDDNEIKTANQLLNPIRAKLNVQDDNTEIPATKKMVETFRHQVKVILEEKVPVCSFTFGIPSREIINELKQNGTVVIGTATTVHEAVEIEKCGMDMVVVQGSEAGGHRGNFLEGHQESQIGLFSLVPQVVDKVSIPVIAAGGIMDGRGLQAAICLGAKAVQMGTAFLTCMESGASEIHKDEILHTSEDQTVFTRSFSGKWARGIKNRFISELENRGESIPDFPVQNKLTKEIRKAATQQNNREYMSLWSGQSPRLAKKQTVKSLIESIMK
ncbi:NAD(P)H-dependent flavin oxidoreductase [Gracilibacillus massiliensis]|uniref:NAD(P)H-dependent flavin oxidoreductase n=1 Tax=Gracilibacillus massiliensis TaxID=1564956 RepID=UPI00071D8F4D|nr:nitronate monooxygenase [Gracilibacillus massiliensis]